MKLQYFTYFLNKLQQPPLFKDKRDKNDIFQSILINENKPIYYESYGTEHAFVALYKSEQYLQARLGRKALFKRHLPPDKQFRESTEEDWPHCNIFINFDNNPNNGQRVAFEYNSKIFPNPSSQLKGLEDKLNQTLLTYGYVMAISPITEDHNFWDVVKKNEKNIQKVTLTFNAPNLFNLNNELEDDLKVARDRYGMTQARIELENPYGELKIPDDDGLMTQGAEYIAKGGGDYRIKMKKGSKIVRSKDSVKTVEIKDLEIEVKRESDGQKTIMSIFKKIFE